jgi:hypothetical protein
MVSDTVCHDPRPFEPHAPFMSDIVLPANNGFKKNAPHLMAESGARGLVSDLKVVVMTITPVTLLPGLHDLCQPVVKSAEPPIQRIQGVIVFCDENGKSARMTMFYTG